MMVVSGLFTALSRLMGGVATMTVGWAVVLLFGRVTEEKRTLLAFIALGSLAWLGAAIAVSIPGIGTFVVTSVPRPAFIALAWLSWVVLATALLMPLAIGAATVSIVAAEDRPKGLKFVLQLLRGYLYAPVMAFTILFLAGVAVVRKVRSLQHGWQSDHLPVLIKAGKYEAVVDAIETALRHAGLPVRRQFARRVLEAPPRLLAAVSGIGIGSLIPDRLIELRIDGLGILVYPSDLALLGPEELLARARAVMAKQLAFSDAYLTQTAETEEIEDRLSELAKCPTRSAVDFEQVDARLGELVVSYGDWETLYRLRLQAEHGVGQEANA